MAQVSPPSPLRSLDGCCFPKRHNQTLNAISFGLIATAVLFALFLIMAIFERVLRPHRTLQPRNHSIDEEPTELQGPETSDSQKPELRHVNSYSRAVSVLMPGQDFPTYFATLIPSPLDPEGVEWPSHAESSQHDPATLQHSSSKKQPARIDVANGSEKGGTLRIGDAIIVETIREKGTSSENGGTLSS